MIQEYITNEGNSVRYVLGKWDRRPIVFFGINPSKATAEENDTTISIVEKIAKMRNADGYIMLNIYPVRATNITKNFPKAPDESIENLNLEYIRKYIPTGSEIVAAWGSHITDRKFFLEAVRKIDCIVKQKNANWICLCKTKKGHPHHPTRLAYKKMTFENFDIEKYISENTR